MTDVPMDLSPTAAHHAWDSEYDRAGIPSSHRDEPSGVVLWALTNAPFLGISNSGRAIDVGCGKGRNTVALHEYGFQSIGVDFSERAIAHALARPESGSIGFQLGDVVKGLPATDSSISVALDIFVYFHQVSDEARRNYRRELHRVLRPDGILVLSLATSNDGYYSSCPRLSSFENGSSIDVRWDPEARVGNFLPTETQLVEELSDVFAVEMRWLKRKAGIMHGRTYVRETLALICRPTNAQSAA